MQKTHQSPEFTVIKQDQANAKFFVASFGTNDQTPTPTPQPTQAEAPGVTNSSASSYGQDQQGFTF